MATTKSINALSNGELKTALTTMMKALESGRKSTWDYADSIYNIVKGEYFKDDFKSLKEFAEYINLSKASISQYMGAVETKAFLAQFKDIKNLDEITVTKAYLLGTLGDMLEIFMKEKSISVLIKSTDKYFKEVLAEWKKSKEPEEEDATVVDSEPEKASEETPEKASEEAKPEKELDAKTSVAKAIATIEKVLETNNDSSVATALAIIKAWGKALK
nr:MAG TPA: KorB domain [Caudoviricetes sp.]